MPFDRVRRRIGRGHLVPDLAASSGGGFLRLPGLKRVSFGMIGFLGPPVTTAEILERWRESGTVPLPDEEAAGAIDGYLRQVQAFKVGMIVEISYGPGGFVLTMVARTPRADKPFPL